MSNTYNWYKKLQKPSFAPPAWVFGPVWTVLYIIIAITFGKVFYESLVINHLPMFISLPFVLNIIFNLLFTPIQFKLKNNLLASFDILLVVGTLIWALITVWQVTPNLSLVVYANIPYLLWGMFATVLQLRITWINR